MDYKSLYEQAVVLAENAFCHDPMGQNALDQLAADIKALAPSPTEQPVNGEASLQRIQLSDDAWLERVGPLNLWALYRPTGYIRQLNRFEMDFVDSTIHALKEKNNG